jgi:hypothetical protein
MKILNNWHFTVLFFLIFIYGCVPPSSNLQFDPVITHGTWETTNYDKVFNGVVLALHSTGYMIIATDKVAGLITVEEKTFPVYDKQNNVIGYGSYRLNALVVSESSGAVTVSIQWKGGFKNQPDKTCTNCTQWTNNEVGRRFELLFQKIEMTIGKPSKIGRNIAIWK